jgi:Peptidase inhibitor family I36
MIARLLAGFAVLLAVPCSLSAQNLTWGRPPLPRSGVCFYNWPNFDANKGKYFCRTMGQDITQLPKDFNNAISSIRVFGGVTVRLYSDFNFRGASLVVRHDIADLKTVGWNNRISSMSIRQR